MATHTIMKKSLAKALMDAGMHHFDIGGPVSTFSSAGGTPGSNGLVQQGLAGALTPQSGYNANTPTITTQNLAPVIQQGQQQQNQVYNQQQNLAQALLNQSNGQGPNVAQNSLNQSTGANVANQAALAAGQRGSSQNVGLLERQNAQQGAATQEQAAGTAATLQAQQEVSAEQQAAAVQNAMANEALQGQSINQGAQAAENTAINTGTLGAEQVNAGTANQNAASTQGTMGGLISGVGSALSSIFYKGGKVPAKDILDVQPQKFDVGGIANYSSSTAPNYSLGPTQPGTNELAGVDKLLNFKTSPANPLSGATSAVPSATGGSVGGSAAGGATWAGADAGGSGLASLALLAASKGGKIPQDFRQGGPVPGKAKIPGKNDPRNDDQLALLSPGEEVLPLSVTKSDNPEKKAVEFMKHLKNVKEEKDQPKAKGFGKVIQAKKSLKDRVEQLEKTVGQRQGA